MADPKKNKFSKTLTDYALISLGVAVFCLAWDCFLIPNNIAAGGLTGLCTIIQFGTGIPLSYTYVAINAALIIFGSIILGRGFGVKTLYAIALSTVLFRILPEFSIIQSIEGQPLYVGEKLLIPVIGGLMEAIGLFLILYRGGSTGGNDIVALLLNKFWPITLGRVYLYSDMIIITSILLVPGRGFEDMLYGYITMITSSLALDAILLGRQSSVQVLIFSARYREIADHINKNMARGATVLNATGWYTKEAREVVLVLLRKSELRELTKAIKEIDRDAFVSVCKASSVFGEGFEEMKTGIDGKNK